MNLGSLSGFVGFFMFLIACIWFKSILGKSGKKSKKETEQFLNAEHEANFSRAHEIPAEMFYHPGIDNLPNTEYGDKAEFAKLAQLKQKAFSGAQSTMLRLNPPLKNIEIKQKFGAANLEKITNYETSYEQYIRSLSNWADELVKLEFYEDAKKVLSICIEMDSLIFLPYSLLCDIYVKEKNIAELDSLKSKVISTNIIANNELLSKKIIAYIDEKLKEIE